MADSESNHKNEKGFAGLNSLVSDISASTERTSPTESPQVPSPMAITSTMPPLPASPSRPLFIQSAQPSGSGRLSPVIVVGLGIAVVLFFAWVANLGSANRNQSPQSFNPAPASSSPAPTSDTASSSMADRYMQTLVEEQKNTPVVPEDSPAPSDPTSSPSSAANAASSPESASSSQMPPVAQNYILSLPEFFWCKKETIRLDVIKSVMDNADPQQTIRFNAMVNNFDSRCAQNHYRNGDLEIVERELAQERDSIAAEAKSEWVGKSRVLGSSTNVTIPAERQRGMQDQAQPPGALAAQEQSTVELQVQMALRNWIAAMRSNDPSRISQCYADRVDRYFLQQNWDRQSIKNYLTRWFQGGRKQFGAFGLSSLTIQAETPDAAQVKIVKSMTISDLSGQHESLTRSELHFEKMQNGEWLITSERDFK